MSRLCDSAARSGDAETLPKVDPAHVLVADHLLGVPLIRTSAVVQDVGSVDDFERLAHVVVGDQNADAALS